MSSGLPRNLTLVFLIIIVASVVSAVHWPSLSATALSFDDNRYFTENALVKNPSWRSAKRFLAEVLEPSTVRGYYQPLTMISLMLDYAAGGRDNNLRPFHITSLALHTANTALVIVLLYMLFGNIWAATAAGLLFGVHPMMVEPIPWVGERKTLLAAFFALWSLILYVRYSRSGGWKSYVGCFAMYLLSLLSKPTSVPLPIVMLLMDYWPLKRLNVKSFLEKLPLFALAGVSAIVTYISQHRTAGTVAPAQYGPWHVPFVLCHNIIFYLYKMLLPVNLSSHYPFPKPLDLSSGPVLAGVIGTCVLIALLLISLRWTRAALTGWLIFFVAIFPTMGVVGFTNVIASDKYAYLPAVGILMAVTAFLIWLGRNKKTAIALGVIVLALAGAEAVATQRYLRYWHDTESLYSHMIGLAPNAPTLLNDFGAYYYKKGHTGRAVELWSKAIEIYPDYADALNNLAWILATDEDAKKRNGERAAQMAEKACQLDGYKDAAKLDTLAAAYAESGRFDEAVAVIRKGLLMAAKSEQKELVEEMSKRLELYQKGQAFHGR